MMRIYRAGVSGTGEEVDSVHGAGLMVWYKSLVRGVWPSSSLRNAYKIVRNGGLYGRWMSLIDERLVGAPEDLLILAFWGGSSVERGWWDYLWYTWQQYNIGCLKSSRPFVLPWLVFVCLECLSRLRVDCSLRKNVFWEKNIIFYK